MFRFGLFVVCLLANTLAAHAADGELRQSPLAKAFGSQPDLFGVSLSPDGTKLSILQMHPEGATIARVVDLAGGGTKLVLAGKANEFDITWCDWANNDRLLCGLRFVELTPTGIFAPVTRLVGVQADGTRMQTLLASQMQDMMSQYQDRVVDWLVDDPDHVLVVLQDQSESALGDLDINTGRASVRGRPKEDVYGWLSDGHGEPRLYLEISEKARHYYFLRLVPRVWEMIHETPLTATNDDFSPIGFGEDRDELLYYDRQGDRMAIFGIKLDDTRTKRLVYAHDKVDVAGLQTIGKYRRFVAARYVEERPRVHYFDARVGAIHAQMEQRFPDRNITIIDEDWDQRHYLIFVSADTDPGTYYRFDASRNALAKIAPAHSKLKDIPLAPMREVRYPAEDGVQVPAYLTLPTNSTGTGLPAVVLPHGGPSSRDYWTFNFLAQFLAANGYAVLQSNYRGSSGYGAAWEGAGGFQNWRVAVDDIAAGAKYLAAQGIADPNRICVVGWSYGGYAALMSSIEKTDVYRCAVSIAGVADPELLGDTIRENYVGGRSAQVFIGDEREVIERGSPINRVAEVNIPLLLFHPRKDVNVPFQQGQRFHEALRRAGKDVPLIIYEDAEHDIRPERYRIDLLTRIGAFLQQHLGPR